MGLESLLSKMAEAKATHGDIGNAMGFDPDKRIDINENRTTFADRETTFDPDKRIDVNEGHTTFTDKETKYDPDKRIELQENSNADIEQGKELGEDKTPEKIKCENEALVDKKHPKTEVPFVKKIVEVEGKLYEVVVPQFDSKFDAQLPTDQLKATDSKQFQECNAQLKDAIASNEELREQFNDEQLEQIENGDTPDGYTWHHDAEVGKMQLVDTEIHQRTGHTGGRLIWGGGTENR